MVINHKIVHNQKNLKQLLRIFPMIRIYEIINPTTFGALGMMTQKDKPSFILDFINYQGIFEEQGNQLAKIVEKISGEFGIIIGMCPPFPFLAKFQDNFDIPFFSQFHYHSGNQQSYFQNSIAFLKSLDIKGLIFNDDSTPIRDLEKNVRDSRTNRLYTLVYSHNVAISAALSKFDPNAIVISLPDMSSTGTPLSKIPPEMIENHVKRIHIENSKVSVFSSIEVHEKADIERVLELQVDVFVLDISSVSLKDPYEFLVNLVKPLKN